MVRGPASDCLIAGTAATRGGSQGWLPLRARSSRREGAGHDAACSCDVDQSALSDYGRWSASAWCQPSPPGQRRSRRRSRLATIHTPRSNARRGSPAEVAELGALTLSAVGICHCRVRTTAASGLPAAVGAVQNSVRAAEVVGGLEDAVPVAGSAACGPRTRRSSRRTFGRSGTSPGARRACARPSGPKTPDDRTAESPS